jgi:hypothetical protein
MWTLVGTWYCPCDAVMVMESLALRLPSCPSPHHPQETNRASLWVFSWDLCSKVFLLFFAPICKLRSSTNTKQFLCFFSVDRVPDFVPFLLNCFFWNCWCQLEMGVKEVAAAPKKGSAVIRRSFSIEWENGARSHPQIPATKNSSRNHKTVEEKHLRRIQTIPNDSTRDESAQWSSTTTSPYSSSSTTS